MSRWQEREFMAQIQAMLVWDEVDWQKLEDLSLVETRDDPGDFYEPCWECYVEPEPDQVQEVHPGDIPF